MNSCRQLFNPARGRLATTCASSARGAQTACWVSRAAAPLFKRNFTPNRAAFLVPAAGSRQAVVRVGFASPRTRQGWPSQPTFSSGAAAPGFLQPGLLRVRRASLRLLAAVGGWRCRAAGRRASGRRRVRFALRASLGSLALASSCACSLAASRRALPRTCAYAGLRASTPQRLLLRASRARRKDARGAPSLRPFIAGQLAQARPAVCRQAGSLAPVASQSLRSSPRPAALRTVLGGRPVQCGSRREAGSGRRESISENLRLADGPRPSHHSKRAA